MGLEWAKRRQDDPNEDIKSLKVPKSSIYKNYGFIKGKLYFSRLGGSQEEYKRFRKAPGADSGSEMDPNMDPKLGQKWNQTWKPFYVSIL